MENVKIYDRDTLLAFPTMNEEGPNEDRVYNGIIVVPTGAVLEDAGGYPEFAIIGCRPELIPKEIITYVHGAEFDGLLDPIKGAIKFDMIGDGIFRFFSKQNYMTFGLNSSETLDIDLIPR